MKESDMSQEKILVIDDESSIQSSLQGILEDEGYLVKTAESGEDGVEMLRSESFDAVLLDVWLPSLGGIEVLQKILTLEDAPQVIMISGHGTIETAVKAAKLGAYDFLEKPLSLQKVVITVQNALRRRKLEEENLRLREKVRGRFPLIGRSPGIQKLRQDIERAAPSNGRVLITGENGTGKERIVYLIHQQSRRRDKKLVEINCAAIPDDLIDNELFGCFQDDGGPRAKDKKGKFLIADRGTLFLDEIGDMSLKTQSRLVQAIEDGKIEPAGAPEPIPVDVRIIAASSRNLREAIAKGRFREDLFFKLNVIPLNIPPLRNRVDDIPLLIEYFLDYFSAEYGKRPKTMSPEAERAFLNYSWPGNVSELMNVIERFVIMVPDDVIQAGHLALLVETRETEAVPELVGNSSLAAATEQFERTTIRNHLLRNGWDVSRTALALKIEEGTLRKKIADYGITLSD